MLHPVFHSMLWIASILSERTDHTFPGQKIVSGCFEPVIGIRKTRVNGYSWAGMASTTRGAEAGVDLGVINGAGLDRRAWLDHRAWLRYRVWLVHGRGDCILRSARPSARLGMIEERRTMLPSERVVNQTAVVAVVLRKTTRVKRLGSSRI